MMSPNTLEDMSLQQLEIVDDIRWKHPSTVMIGGPSGSGKTELTNSILTNRNYLFNPVPQKAILYYREWQEVYGVWKKMGFIDEFYDSFPDEEEFRDRLDLEGTGTVVVFDDFFLHVEKNKSFFDNLFCINSHHLKVSVILIVHNLFTKDMRTLSLNCHRFFLTQSLRDKGQLQSLARQAFPGKSDFVIQAFDDSMKARYGHICLDFSPDCNSVARVTSNWFASPSAINCYVYKTDMKSPAGKMGPKAFTKLILLPQNRYLKLLSNDCNCKLDDQPPISNSLHVARNPPRLQSMEFDNKVSNFTAEDRKETKNPEGTVESRDIGGDESQKIFQPFPDSVDVQSEVTSSDLSPHTPPPPHLSQSTPMEATPSLSQLPPPPPPSHMSQPLLSPLPLALPQPLPTSIIAQSIQPQLPQNQALTPSNRIQLHQELQKAIADRSGRSTPYFIDRPPPQPLPPTLDVRQDMHDELQQVVAGRRTSQDREQKTLEFSGAGQKALEYSTPKEKSIEFSNPTRALENLNAGRQPESNYPIALRSLDSDIAPPVKKTSKIPKRKLLKPSVFSPSPPISNAVEGQNLKAVAKKRRGDHLSKPKSTQNKKVAKLNQGQKRPQNFPLRAGKRATSYRLWDL